MGSLFSSPSIPHTPPPPPAPLPDYASTQQTSADTQQRQRAAAALAAGRESTILGGAFVQQPGKRMKLGES